jgi:hypothetical protein
MRSARRFAWFRGEARRKLPQRRQLVRSARRSPRNVSAATYARCRVPRRPRSRSGSKTSAPPRVDRTPPWSIVYYAAPDRALPALEFLDACPGKIDAEFTAVLDAVAAAPPPQFSGGGKWEAMHGAMTGWHEIRLTGPGREQFGSFACSRTPKTRSCCGRDLASRQSPSSPVCESPGGQSSQSVTTHGLESSGMSTGGTIRAGLGCSRRGIACDGLSACSRCVFTPDSTSCTSCLNCDLAP